MSTDATIEKVGIAHQYKIREAKSKENKRDLFGVYGENVNLDLKNAVVKKVSRATAKKVILEYEWLGTMSPTTHHYGIYFDNVLGGVVCYGKSCTANYNCSMEFNIEPDQLWFLARGACVHWTPVGSASKLIAQSLKLLEKDVPHARVVLAYSDTDAGEIGTVYQATNWIYIGRGNHKTFNWRNPKTGRQFDERMLHNLKYKYNLTRPQVRRKLLDEGWEVLPKTVKHRYCFPLGSNKQRKEVIRHLEGRQLIKPYPKRDGSRGGSLKGETPATQQEG